MKCKEWGFSWSASLETKLDFFKEITFWIFCSHSKITSSWRTSIQSTLQASWFAPHVGLAHRRWGGVWVYRSQWARRSPSRTEQRALGFGDVLVCLTSWLHFLWLFWLGCSMGFWGQKWPLCLMCHSSCLCLKNCSGTVYPLKKEWPSNTSRPKEMSG